MYKKMLVPVLLLMFISIHDGLQAQDYTFSDDMPKSVSGPVPRPLNPATWQSKMLEITVDGRLRYIPDADGFVLPDFSNAGYRNGDVPLPDVPTVKAIDPVAGDNTAHIQKAIDDMATLTPDANGIRGALLLKKGLYRVVGPIYLNVEGVTLRGEGNTGDTAVSTVIFDTHKDLTAASGRAVLVVGNKSNDNWDTGKNNETYILDDVVPVGSHTVHIARNENYRAGDLVCLYHPCTATWLAAVKYGETFTPGGTPEGAWTSSSAPIYYHRYVRNVVHEGNMTTITLDAPVFYSLNKSLSQCTIYRFTRKALRNIGLENMRIDIANKGIPDDYHAWDAVNFCNMEDGWARKVVTMHFGAAGFETMRSTRLTIENCYALDPVGTVTGGMGYNFCTYQRSQLILFKNCYARSGRHNYISNGTSTTSGCVVYHCKSEGSRASSEGHRIWTQGMLFDCYEDFNPISTSTATAVLGFYNRMDMGSGHGWAMAHGVLWNCNVQTDRNSPDAIANSPSKARSVIYCEKPPTAQNYAIGCYTHQASDVRAYKYAVGYVEGANVYGLKPESLYEAQYAERHNDINLKIISQPVGVQSCTGSFIQLSVSVEAADMNSVTYQWFKDGNEIVGQTARQLTLSAATIDDAGVYYVRVSCFGKTINSEQATVALIRSLPDEMQLSGFPSSFDKNTTLHILVGDPVTGTYPDVIAYQWSYSGTGVTFTSRTANPVEMLVGAAPTNGTISVLVFHPCGVKTVSRNITFGPVNNLNPALINVFFQNNFLYVGNIRSARSLSVIDLNGREMYYASLTNKIEFSALLNNFRSGIYIVSIISSDGSNIRKILVKH